MSRLGDDKLAGLRSAIDARDLRILRELEGRLSLSEEVSKAKSGKDIFRPGREADLIVNLMKQSDLPRELIECFWRSIIAQSLSQQSKLKISHSRHKAVIMAMEFRFGVDCDFSPLNNASGVVKKVASGEADLGVVPHWDVDRSWIKALQYHGKKVYIASYAYLSDYDGVDQAVIVSPFLPDPSRHDKTIVLKDGEVQMIDGHQPDSDGCLGMVQVIDAKKVGGK